MKKEFVQEIMHCFGDEKLLYAHFKDKYSVLYLEQLLRHGTYKIADLKRSNFAYLCEKPFIKQWLASLNPNAVDKHDVFALYPQEQEVFFLSLGQWGGDDPRWQQSCRRGYNLVLQMNFTKAHDLLYEQVFDDDYSPFECQSHPIHKTGRKTIAWSRIDLSDDMSIALIEEVQNDWLRYAKEHFQYYQRDKRKQKNEQYYVLKKGDNAFDSYYQNVILPLEKQWSEAMLTASIEFLVKDIGVKHIYYYDYDTGVKLKHATPPKSLYTKLPKKMGFRMTSVAPNFLYDDAHAKRKLKKVKQQNWYKLNLEV